jgi:pantoate--beta-alanine ligase
MLVNSIVELQNLLQKLVHSSKSIGFVPTMGALHEGHLRLIQRASIENDCVVVSIFVNPTQFNNPNDLFFYPRTLDSDLKLLDKHIQNHIVFCPEEEEIYPSNDDFKSIELGHLDQVLEAKFRPGHFQGVVHVVHNLFKIIQPNKAYFGQKDFQQLAIIRFMTKHFGFQIEIVACETHREPSGLAMSSRNMRLSDVQKREALIIWKTLNFVKENRTNLSPGELKEKAIRYFENGTLKLEYLELVDSENLMPVNDWCLPTICCIAAYCSDVRLIDNLLL